MMKLVRQNNAIDKEVEDFTSFLYNKIMVVV